jgi:4-hydroxybenzoate polyprenyltransferase
MIEKIFMSQRINDYVQLMRADKPIGTLLLLWPTFWGLWLSAGIHQTDGWVFVQLDPYVVIVFVIGVFLMRSAGCVVNDFADRDFDKHVKRTQNRPLTAGRVSTTEALMLFSALVVLALLFVLSLPDAVRWNVLVAAVPALLVAIAYPYMKRFFVTPQLVLGIAFSCGIPMTFLAHGKSIDFGVAILMLANLVWVIAYDTAYGMVDRDDDVAIGIQSSALFFGQKDRHVIGVLQFLTLLLLALVGFYYTLNAYYYVLLLVSSLFFVYQQWLIKDRERESCFAAFLNNAWFGAFIFGAIILGSQ